MRIPTISDVLRARRVLAAHLTPTPMSSASIAGVDVVLKHENTQPTGAFKVRGGITLLAGMDPVSGVLGYSTGNHAQSLAYAARLFGVPCTIVMPVGANPAKAAAVRALGAELVEFGANFDDTRRYAGELAGQWSMRLVSAANEPDLIAGVGTTYLEIVEREPDLDAIIVPVGSGSGAAAACLVAAALAPGCEVYAVQSAASPAAHDSWRAGHVLDRPNQTVVEGLATGSGFELTQRVLRAHLADFLLVDDADIRQAQWVMLRDLHTLAEGAGAAGLAALLKYRDRFAGRKVGLVCTGGNAGEAELRACLAAAPQTSFVPAY